jgi:hypothetical protein
VSEQDHAGIQVSVTAPGRLGTSRLDVHCAECGATESKYVPRGTVSITHVCGSGWEAAPAGISRARATG